MPKKKSAIPGDYGCHDCGADFNIPDGKDHLAYLCPKCGGSHWGIIHQTGPRTISCKDEGWQLENRGRGRFIGGLGKRSDPNSYCRSLGEATEKAKRMGKSYEIG